MKIVLFQILFTCLVAAKESACTINCPKIEMDKMYIVKACTGEGDNERCIDISQAGPGLDVKFDNDEEAILICVNGSRNTLKANTTIKITPNDQLTPNLLTIKTLDNLKSTVSISNDKSTILISLTPNTPEGKFVLQYNGEVDVKLDSVTANPPTQTYTFSSPLFVQTSDPVNTTVNNADFKLTDYAAICKLLCDYYCTATFICSHATFNEVNVDSFDLLSRLYEAECTRISIYNSYSSATKPKSVAPAKKILCLGAQKEDFRAEEQPRDRLLSILKNIVNSHGWSLQALGLPEPSVYIETDNNQQNRVVVNVEEKINSLNDLQRSAFDSVVASIGRGGSLFFLDGPAGSGKTYLYNVLTAYLKQSNKSVIQLATTGIAADLLENGRTVHSGMKLPVPLSEASVSRLQPNTAEGVRVVEASLILIDEVSMMSKYALDAIDEVLKRLCHSNDAFGGKTVLLGGDFRQASNIVLKGTPLDIIESSLPSARSWRHVNVLRLSANMRSSNQGMFADWLISIGNGSLTDREGQVTIPEEYLEKGDLVEAIFGDKMIEVGDETIYNKIILTTKNEHSNVMNAKVSNLLRGQEKVYRSADAVVSDDPSEALRYPTEFLNRQQPSGMPPHELRLKIGSIIMLLRNLDPKRGLLNGIRLCVTSLHNNFIVGQVITGKAKGFIVSIPRIDMMPSETTLPFVLRRRQFPVMLSFAMTIHKSQGQSFDKVGVYLPEPVFAHGQLYVALSRVRNGSSLRVSLPLDAKGKTKNIVYKELVEINR